MTVTVPFESVPSFHALHVVRVRGRVPTESVKAALGRDDAIELLRPLAQAGLVEYHTGRAAGWSVTKTGRDAHAEQLADERGAAACADVLRCHYDAFVEVNPTLIELCTAHQLRPDGAPNDHTDTEYDAQVLAKLIDLDRRAGVICEALGGAMRRFAPYRSRLAAAVTKIGAGDAQWFTGLLVDSYHTVWFELHEDLLLTLGLDRRAEPA